MFISNTENHTLEALGFDVVEDAQFSILTVENMQLEEAANKKLADSDPANCVTFPAGFRFEGRITHITLHSGVIKTF